MSYENVHAQIAQLRAEGHTDIVVTLDRETQQGEWGEVDALPREKAISEFAGIWAEEYAQKGLSAQAGAEQSVGEMMDAEEFESLYPL